jgi:iron complex transport system substrate-binding protein
MKKTAAFACLLALAATLVPASPAPETATPAATAPYTVTDALGRKITFAAIPQRIYIGGRAVFMAADALWAFPEVSGRLLGTSEIDQGLGNFLKAIDPRYADRAGLPTQASAEQIIALKPDTVILKVTMAESLGKPLEAMGLPVVYVDFESPGDYGRDLKVFGELLRNDGRAQAIKRTLDERVAGVTLRVAAAPSPRPRVLFLYDARRGAEHVFNVPPAGWIQTRLVELSGGTPVWKDANAGQGWSRVGFEQIAAWNPDWIFVASYRPGVDDIVRGLAADPAWQALKAARDGRLVAFPVDYYSWDQPELRWVLGLQWLAQRLRPALFQGLDLDREVIDYFSFLYGLSEDQVRRVVLANLKGGYR